MLPRPALLFALTLLAWPAAASSQTASIEPEAVPPAHIAHVEGTVTLERDGRLDTAPLNVPLMSGDRLKTADGRVEVLFADGSALHLDVRTTIDVQSDELLRLMDGRIRLALGSRGRADRSVAYRIDSPAGSIRITEPGDYRIALLHGADETQLELAVLRGSGEIFTDQGSTPLRAGERAYASAGLAPSYAYAYNSANQDGFDRWSESRRATALGLSSQYLPEDVRPYSSTFDEYGDWRYETTYGYVWYPRVRAGWRPYYYGRWAPYPRYGWTWIGVDAFAWPTHHYGRWGFSSGLWFWIPSARWAPAYVSWAYAPGYVSWCPLGFDNRPVIAINIFNTRPGFYSSGFGWTAVSSSHFGYGYAHQRAIDWNRWDRRTSFQLAGRAPAAGDVAVPRNSTPIRWAGARAGGASAPWSGAASPRETRSVVGPSMPARAPAAAGSAVPRYTNRGDTIVRSQTERPTAPARPATDASVAASRAAAGGDVAMPRTAPQGPARRIDGYASRPAPSTRGGGERVAPPQRVDPQRYGVRPDLPMYRGRPAEPRADAPPYQPRTAVPSSPRADAPAPSGPIYRARPDAGPPPSSPGYARPRIGGAPPPAAAPPPPAPSPRGGSPGGQRAVPRSGRGGH